MAADVDQTLDMASANGDTRSGMDRLPCPTVKPVARETHASGEAPEESRRSRSQPPSSAAAW